MLNKKIFMSAITAMFITGCGVVGPGDLDSEATASGETLKEDTSYVYQIPTYGSEEDTGIEEDEIVGTEDAPLTIIEYPSHGDIELLEKSVIYTPSLNYYGEDYFKVNYVDYDTGRSTTYSVPLTILAVNDAPTISGTPSTQASAGSEYLFTPMLDDVDDPKETLVVTSTNLPSWLTLNPQNGVIYGVAPASEAGLTYSGITVTVSDGKDSSTLDAWSITVMEADYASLDSTEVVASEDSSSSDEQSEDGSTTSGILTNPDI